MAKLKLQPNPTFSAPVAITVPGAANVSVIFTFKHRSRDDLDTYLKAAREYDDADLIMSCAVGWELEEPFNKENVTQLVQNYISSPKLIFDAYLQELVKAREKN